MDMSVGGEGTVLSRAISPKGFTAISHFFVMDWASVWTDIALGLLISGALAAWVPHQFWQTLFLAHDRIGSVLVGPLIGPLVAIISFVCSVGNVPLAAVLWNGGISFGGVVAFIFADLIILPILDIYRKYYGWRIAGLLFLVFYAAMALAGYAVELLFGVSGLIPAKRHATVAMASVSWNYTTVLNIVFLVIAAMLIWRFMRTGGPDMLRMMAAPAPTNAGSDGHAHHHHS
ncbi:permease [Acidiphilium sp. 34-64-41]|nr:permease [Acidiphilium sp. 34-64-41]